MILAVLFFITFLATEVVSFLLPFGPIVSTSEGLTLHYGVALTVIFVLWFSGRRRPCEFRFPPKIKNIYDSVRLLRRLEISAVFGVILLYINIVFIQGITFSDGIASARESMRVLRIERVDFSAASFLGNLLVANSYVLIAAGIVLEERIPKRAGSFLRQCCIIGILALLTGGREPLWIALGVIMGAVAVRVQIGLTPCPIRMRIPLVIILGLIIFITIIIAWFRIEDYRGGYDSTSQAIFLGGVPIDDQQLDTKSFGAVAPVALYIAHVRWESIRAFSEEGGNGTATFRVVLNTLSRASFLKGLSAGVTNFDGKWIPVNASLWYDLRWAGLGVLLSASALIGLVFRYCCEFTRQHTSVWSSVAGSLLGCVCFTAPMQLAFESIGFIYINLLCGLLTCLYLVKRNYKSPA